MKVYTLLYHENSDYTCSANVTVLTSKEDAQELMRQCYEAFLENSEFNTSAMTDEYYASISDESAIVVDGMDSYNWEIEEHEVTPDDDDAEDIASDVDRRQRIEEAKFRVNEYLSGSEADLDQDLIEEIVDDFYQKIDSAEAENDTWDRAIHDVLLRHADSNKTQYSAENSIKAEDPEDFAKLILESLDSSERTDEVGQRTTPYFVLAHDSKTGISLAVSVTWETHDLEPKDQYFSIHVIDDITPSDAYIETCDPNEESIVKAFDEILKTIMKQ